MKSEFDIKPALEDPSYCVVCAGYCSIGFTGSGRSGLTSVSLACTKSFTGSSGCFVGSVSAITSSIREAIFDFLSPFFSRFFTPAASCYSFFSSVIYLVLFLMMASLSLIYSSLCLTARYRESRSMNSTKAKPLVRPVASSWTRWTRFTSPNFSSKRVLSSYSSWTLKERLLTCTV